MLQPLWPSPGKISTKMYKGRREMIEMADTCSLIIYQGRQCTYKRYIEVCSHNHCCHGKAVNITYSVCMSVALIIQHKLYMHLIVICGLFGCTTFFHRVS